VSLESRISNLEKAVANQPQLRDSGQGCLVGWLGGGYPLPPLSSDATPAERRLHAELTAMDATIVPPTVAGPTPPTVAAMNAAAMGLDGEDAYRIVTEKIRQRMADNSEVALMSDGEIDLLVDSCLTKACEQYGWCDELEHFPPLHSDMTPNEKLIHGALLAIFPTHELIGA